MEFGFGYFPTYDGMRPGEVARMAEQRGYSAIYFAEHTHIPASGRDASASASRKVGIRRNDMRSLPSGRSRSAPRRRGTPTPGG